MRPAARRDTLERFLLLLLTGNLIFAGVAVFRDRNKVGLSEEQLLARLEEAQKEHHGKDFIRRGFTLPLVAVGSVHAAAAPHCPAVMACPMTVELPSTWFA